MTALLSGLSAEQAAFVWITALGLIATLLYLAREAWQRMRWMEDTPTARIRSAAQGYVELQGQAQAMSGEKLISALSDRECCWYHWSIEERYRRYDRNDNRFWNIVSDSRSDGIFYLQDDTGRCVLDPEDAQLSSPYRSVWYGWSLRPERIPPRGTRNAGLFRRLFARYRYTEEIIFTGDPLYVLGWFHTERADIGPQAEAEALKALLREWKQDPAWLLRRFDENNDGEIDQHEWETVRRHAKQQVRVDARERAAHPQVDIISSGGERPFLISTHSQHELLLRARRHFYSSIGIALVIMLWLAWFSGLSA